VLDDIFLQHALGHATRFASREKTPFSHIVAISAFQVAVGAGRLDEHLKIAASFGPV